MRAGGVDNGILSFSFNQDARYARKPMSIHCLPFTFSSPLTARPRLVLLVFRAQFAGTGDEGRDPVVPN